MKAIRAARMFDGLTSYEGPVLILVEDGKIRDVDLTGAAPPPHAELIDLGGMTVLPGLIDAHTHLSWDPAGKHEEMATQTAADLLPRTKRHAEQALRAGVTTLRDLGDRDYVTLQLREEYPEGPEVLTVGPPITRTGGHCWYLGGAADTSEELVEAVTERAERGTDWVKVMATGGFSTNGTDPTTPQYTAAQLTTLVETARAHGLPVTAHAHASTGIKAAVEAGVNGVEHCTFHTPAGAVIDPEIVDVMARKGIWAGITLSRPRADRPQWVRTIVENIVPRAATLLAAGVNVVLCTDAGIVPTKPHGALPNDLVFAAGKGLTNLQVLTAATSSAAACCHVGDRKGRLATGYDADLIAVADDPLRRIETILEVRAVFRAGDQPSLTDAAAGLRR